MAIPLYLSSSKHMLNLTSQLFLLCVWFCCLLVNSEVFFLVLEYWLAYNLRTSICPEIMWNHSWLLVWLYPWQVGKNRNHKVSCTKDTVHSSWANSLWALCILAGDNTAKSQKKSMSLLKLFCKRTVTMLSLILKSWQVFFPHKQIILRASDSPSS